MDAHQPPTSRKQIPLQTPRQVAAVLYGPHLVCDTVGIEPISPRDETEVVASGRADCSLTEPATELVDRDHRVSALVCVDSKDDHRP